MLGPVNDAILAVMDLLVGWLLYLPRDVALLVLGVGSSAILTLVRPFTTNQDLLRRCRDDRTRLKELGKQAKKRGDSEALRRHRATRNAVGMKAFRAEGRPLLVSVVPIALLATWCYQRLAYVPPRGGELVEVRAYLAPSARGRLVHLVPEEGIEPAAGWIGEAVPDPDGGENALALWRLTAEARREPYPLRFRFGERSYDAELLVGRRRYSAPVTFHDEILLRSETALAPYRPMGVVPGDPASAFPPWLMAYLAVVVPFVLVLKRLLGIF